MVQIKKNWPRIKIKKAFKFYSYNETREFDSLVESSNQIKKVWIIIWRSVYVYSKKIKYSFAIKPLTKKDVLTENI